MCAVYLDGLIEAKWNQQFLCCPTLVEDAVIQISEHAGSVLLGDLRVATGIRKERLPRGQCVNAFVLGQNRVLSQLPFVEQPLGGGVSDVELFCRLGGGGSSIGGMGLEVGGG